MERRHKVARASRDALITVRAKRDDPSLAWGEREGGVLPAGIVEVAVERVRLNVRIDDTHNRHALGGERRYIGGHRRGADCGRARENPAHGQLILDALRWIVHEHVGLVGRSRVAVVAQGPGGVRHLEAAVLEVGVLKVGVLEIRILEIGVLEVGVLEIGVQEIDILEVGVFEVGILEVGILEVGILEVGIPNRRRGAQRKVFEVGIFEVRVLEIEILEIRIMQFRVFEIGVLEIRVFKIRVEEDRVEGAGRRSRAFSELIHLHRHEHVGSRTGVGWGVLEPDKHRAGDTRPPRDAHHNLRHRRNGGAPRFERAKPAKLVERRDHSRRRHGLQQVIMLAVGRVPRHHNERPLQAGDAFRVLRCRHDQARPELRRVDVLVADANLARDALHEAWSQHGGREQLPISITGRADVAVVGPGYVKHGRRPVRGLTGVPRPSAVCGGHEALAGNVDVVADEGKATLREDRQIGPVVLQLLAGPIHGATALDVTRDLPAAAQYRRTGQVARTGRQAQRVGHGRAHVQRVPAAQAIRAAHNAVDHGGEPERPGRARGQHALIENLLAVLEDQVIETAGRIVSQVVVRQRHLAAGKGQGRHDLVAGPQVGIGDPGVRPARAAD